jgi:hypothetical protein
VTAAERQLQEGKDPYAAKRGDSEEVKGWRKRMASAEGKEKYKRRGLCEWSNAQCRNRGLYQVSVRGQRRVLAVVLWYVLVQNLLRMV